MMQILALDVAGNPAEWMSHEKAIHHYTTGKVAWELGDAELVFRGGYSNAGIQSEIVIRPIIALAGSEIMARMFREELPLENDLLFRRDNYRCAYCGERFPKHRLTRDHVLARSRGGADRWGNVVSACERCNHTKGSLLVDDFRPLIYVPYAPCRFEHFLLSGRNIITDQTEYLSARLPRHSRQLM